MCSWADSSKFEQLCCHGIVAPVIEPVPDSARRVITRM
jgi:hypothetical protein